MQVSYTSLYPIDVGTYTLWVGFLGQPGDYDDKPFVVVRNDTVRKYLFFNDPASVIQWNGTDYELRHIKIGDPYSFFDVTYPLINDTFTTTTWPLTDFLEIIGFTEDYVNLTFYSLTWNLLFQFLNITLVNGYNLTLLQGKEIPFLPYGNYTLRFSNATINGSVDDRRIFMVYMGVDVDVSPCRNGTFEITIVGGAPYTEYNFTFDYQIYDLIFGHVRYIYPYWTGEFVVTVTTDRNGTGFTSIPLTSIYTKKLIFDKFKNQNHEKNYLITYCIYDYFRIFTIKKIG